jgi:hypothetical protein
MSGSYRSASPVTHPSSQGPAEDEWVAVNVPRTI